jgi:hypothetical protein
MLKHKDSHLDHGLSPEVVDHIFERFTGRREGFFIETFELPPELGTVPCGLFGPVMGDAPITNAAMVIRGNRTHVSRVLNAAPRPTRTVTVIAGPHDGFPCVLYTAFGGPSTPKEPNDPTLAEDKREESAKFWSEHALAITQ